MSSASRLCQVFFQVLAVLVLWSPDGFPLAWAASPGGEVDLRSQARRRKLHGLNTDRGERPQLPKASEQGASPATLNRCRRGPARSNGEDLDTSPPAGLFSPVTPDQGNYPAAASTTDGRTSGNKRDHATKSTTSVPFLKVRPHDPDTDEPKGVVENASLLTKTVLCGGAVLAKLLWTLASFYLPGRLLAWASGRPTEVLRQRPLQNLEWMVRTFPFNFDMVLEMDKDEYETILRKITNPELRKEAERATSFVEVTHLKHDVTMQLHLPAKEKLPEGEKWKAEYSGLYDDLTGSGDTWTKRGAAHIVLRKVAVPASPPAETGVPPVLQNKVASVLFGLADADAAERSRGGLVATLHGSRATDERAGVRVENTFWYFPADNTRYYPAPKGSEGVVPISLYDEKVRDAARGKSSASAATPSAKVVKAAVTSIVARVETQNWHVLRKLVRLLLAKAPIAIPNHVCQLDPLLFACLGSKQPFSKTAAGRRSTCPVPSTTTLPTGESGCAGSFSKQLSYDSVPEDAEILPSGRTAGLTLTHAAGDQGAAAGTGGTAGGEHFSGRDAGGIAKSIASTGIAAPFKTGTKAPNVSEAEGDMELWAGTHIHPEENNLLLGAEEHKLNGWMGMNVNQQLQQAEYRKANPPLPTPKAFAGSSRANKYYYPTGRAAPPPQQPQKPGEASMDSSGCPQDDDELDEDAPFPIRGPKFVSHHGVRGLPMFGAVCGAWGGVFVDRDDAESRKACAQAIMAHCDHWASEMSRAVDDDSTAGHFCNDGEDLDPLILFPEGGLTNGEFVGDFKGGAAAHPTAKVRPVLLKYLGPETSSDREGDAGGGDHAGNMAEVQYYATPDQLSAVLEAAKNSHRKQLKENDESSTSPAASSEWTSDDAEDEEDASVRELREKLLKTTLTMDKKDLQQRSTGTWFARHVIPESFCGKRKVVMRFGKVQQRDLEAHGQASFLQLVQERARQEFLTLPSSVKSLAEGTNA